MRGQFGRCPKVAVTSGAPYATTLGFFFCSWRSSHDICRDLYLQLTLSFQLIIQTSENITPYILYPHNFWGYQIVILHQKLLLTTHNLQWPIPWAARLDDRVDRITSKWSSSRHHCPFLSRHLPPVIVCSAKTEPYMVIFSHSAHLRRSGLGQSTEDKRGRLIISGATRSSLLIVKKFQGHYFDLVLLHYISYLFLNHTEQLLYFNLPSPRHTQISCLLSFQQLT